MRKYSFLLVILGIIVWVFLGAFSNNHDGFNFRYASVLPVLHNGRLKPIDSVMRHTLVGLHEKQNLRFEGRSLDPTVWFFQMMISEEKVDSYPIFRFLNPDKVMPQFLGLDQKKKAYSFNEVKPSLPHLFEMYDKAQGVQPKLRNPFQQDVVVFGNRILVYQRSKMSVFPLVPSYEAYLNEYAASIPSNLRLFAEYQKSGQASDSDFQQLSMFNSQFKLHQWLNQNALFYPIPTTMSDVSNPHNWQSAGSALLSLLNQRTQSLVYMQHYAKMLDAFKENKSETFYLESKELYSLLYAQSPWFIRKMEFERVYNTMSPFYKSAVLYLLCFLVLFISFIYSSEFLYKHSLVLFGSGFCLHTFGIVSRMFLQGRPPVTNLYSSAVFIGWIAILVAIILEKFFKNKLGILVSCVIGFVTLIIAYYLSLSGDTLEMMQAVLDTNFWLSTHVVTVTMGYSGTFLAGFFSILYIFRLVVLPSFLDKDKKEMSRMIYGILCFALLFSFVGTVLGGIWADQSWGRFWGWDPKENGALLIVLWNAIILHARIGGFIRERGMAVCAVFGNIVTAFSWFGTNLLGVGLHSYGFTENGFLFLILFVVSQLMVITLGLLPKKFHISEKMFRG